jgi:hypothetical protein
VKIDFTLVSGARPLLLEPTIRSIQQNILRNFELGTCYANIDLFGGSEADRLRCRDIITAEFPSAVITMPETPGFARAVKMLWTRPQADHFLHFEDDWEVLEDITPRMVAPLFTGDTRSVKLVCKEMHWNGTDAYYERPKKLKLFRRTIWTYRTKTSLFGTGPAFFERDFANRVSRFLDPALDPEKQMRRPYNPPLNDFVEQFRCRVLPGTSQNEIIRDTGRDWQREAGMKKVYSGAHVSWKTE